MTTQWVTMDQQGNIYYSLDGSTWSNANKLLDETKLSRNIILPYQKNI
jgi:hypothetical protein